MENKQEEFKLENIENSKIISKDYLEIEKYYKEAKELALNGRLLDAKSLIYNMPINLYDKSINILFNMNWENFSYPQLKVLIHEVDKMFYGNTLEEDTDGDLSEEDYKELEDKDNSYFIED